MSSSSVPGAGGGDGGDGAVVGDDTTTGSVGGGGGGGNDDTTNNKNGEEEEVAAAATDTTSVALAVVDDPCVYSHPDDTADFKRSFAMNYHLRKKPKTLFAMAMGFPEYYGILDRPPLSTIKRKELNDQYIPKAEDFKQEIKRRSHFFMHVSDEAEFYAEQLHRQHPLKTKRASIVLPQPNQWLNTQLKNWLTDRPMKPTDDDIKFIRYQVKRALEYLAQEGTDGSPEVLRELPIIPTPVDAEVGPDAMAVAVPSGSGAAAGAAAGGAAASSGGGGSGSMSVDGDGDDSSTGGGGAGVKGFVGGGGLPSTLMGAGMTSNLSAITPAATDIETDEYVYQSFGDNGEYKRSAAETFLLKGSKPRILFSLAMGMPEYSELLQTAAYNLVKRKEVMEDFMPKADDYRYEIKRRAHFFMNVEDEVNYYTREMKLKNPLENMRGIVSLPQPNQWKLQALKLWLSERPLKPDPKDAAFLTTAIQKCIDALKDAVSKDPALAVPLHGNKRTSTVLMNMLDPSIGTMGGSISSGAGGASLGQVLQKQDAILSALSKHTKQQTLLSKITLRTQSSMGYQHELASLRSTRNEIESRIINVEMKLAETTTSETQANLRAIITKQEERMREVKQQIATLESKIASIQSEIQTNQAELDELVKSFADDEAAAAAASVAAATAAQADATNPSSMVANGNDPMAMAAAAAAAAVTAQVEDMDGTEQHVSKKQRYDGPEAADV